ncbi:DUF2062 domain-containing protein [Hymenobacter sp. BT559]|jgi:uncharacterized protein (DUF2062 family)|uniref:DUF2062 domain-containing protein n=1 Tax=Hymenobacter sp. BT559 TaxID=2795729 RepID=UPI0018EB084B|nr:DUF2062 domain-containing protein [Hymenobacter sp. BT559]MBJ6142983.1 DUF2062 domain-containing protein [Hymenobacter sp. BT559]
MSITSISATGVRAVPEPPPRTWVQRRLLDPFMSLLKAGLSPSGLALTVGLGVAFGLAPTFGITTIVSTAVALRLRLNVAAIQLVCHLLSPVQLILLLPFLRWGATILGHGEQVANLTFEQIKEMGSAEGWGSVLHLLWRAELGALMLWALAAVPVVAALYVGLRPLFRKVVQRQEEAEAVPA